MAAVVESAQAQSALQPVITAAHRIKEIVRLRIAPFFLTSNFDWNREKRGRKIEFSISRLISCDVSIDIFNA